MTSQKSKRAKAIACRFIAFITLLALVALWQFPQALAILPPHGPNLGNQGDTGNRDPGNEEAIDRGTNSGDTERGARGGGNLGSKDMGRSNLFLMRSNPMERIDAQVQISRLSDKISNLEDPSCIRPDIDMSKRSPKEREVIERALSTCRLHMLADLLTRRGTLLAILGEIDKAIADLGEALYSDNNYAPAYNNRACLEAAGGDFARALQDATKALSISPEFAEAYDTRGSVYLAKKQYVQAEKDYDKAIATRPAYAEAFFHRSLLMRALGKQDSYVADQKKAKELGY